MRLLTHAIAAALAAAAFVAPISTAPPAHTGSPQSTPISRVPVFSMPVSSMPDVDSPSTVAAEDATSVIDVVPAGSGLLRANQDLTLTVVLTNRTATTLPAGTASILFERAVVSDRSDLALWIDGATTVSQIRGTSVADVATPELFVGQTTSIPVTVPAATIALSEQSAFGAHRVSATLAAGDQEFTEGRTAVTSVTGTVPSIGLALAVPLVLPPSTDGLIPADLLASYTEAGGLLDRQLAEALDQPVAIGIDPRIIASINALGDSAPFSATFWLSRLRSAQNETFPLAYSDSDISATSQASGVLLAPTGFALDGSLFPEVTASPTAEPSATPSPSSEVTEPALPTPEELLAWTYTSSGIAWPRDSTVVSADLDAFAANGLTTTILSSTNSSIDELSTTPSASTVIANHTVATSDSGISDLLRQAVGATSDSEWQSVMASLSSTLAAVADERINRRPIDGRQLLATLSRELPLGGFRLEDTLRALAEMPWIQASTLSKTLVTTSTTATLVDQPVADDRVALVRTLIESEAAADRFATVLDDPALITSERRLTLLALTSQSWVGGETGWATSGEQYLSESNDILNGVQVVDSSTLNLIADNGALPITVSNALPYPVTVLMMVRPRTAILNVLDSAVELTIEAGSQRRGSVPVQSVANGEVVIEISLSSPTGVQVTQPKLGDVNVQAGWETAATAVLALIIVAVFALGIVRTVRRRRRVRRDESAGESGTRPHEARPHGAQPGTQTQAGTVTDAAPITTPLETRGTPPHE